MRASSQARAAKGDLTPPPSGLRSSQPTTWSGRFLGCGPTKKSSSGSPRAGRGAVASPGLRNPDRGPGQYRIGHRRSRRVRSRGATVAPGRDGAGLRIAGLRRNRRSRLFDDAIGRLPRPMPSLQRRDPAADGSLHLRHRHRSPRHVRPCGALLYGLPVGHRRRESHCVGCEGGVQPEDEVVDQVGSPSSLRPTPGGDHLPHEFVRRHSLFRG